MAAADTQTAHALRRNPPYSTVCPVSYETELLHLRVQQLRLDRQI